MILPKMVHLCECWGRDGLQNHPEFIPTEQKVRMLSLLDEAGFGKLEATSFSHPKYVPQFRDSEEVLRALVRKDGLIYKATCVNKKALERAIQAKLAGYGPEQVSFVIAASEEYNRINVRMEQAQLLEQLNEMVGMAKEQKLDVLVSVSTAFGCPVKGEVKTDEVLKMVEHFADRGVKLITIGDTTGMANPATSHSLFERLLLEFPDITFVAHFHDTRGWGIANTVAALHAGITHFDVSLGGIGGPPANRVKSGGGFSGNVCTEDFVFLLEDMGIDTGIDLGTLIEAGQLSEQILGQQRSQILRSV
ncbi:hydroxymethylglutaryl-CoA lyase [Brevibacillus sp. NRS-1366]|uniref:hydroxymethylglutaryl-CoA lyase n=1 Tax=Brevibacillus sp. NRS-1366 TaxID=3233899 RepID=UPI003D199DBB